jgi:hypothetical protein
MAKPKELKRGDSCPNCGHELHAAPVPSDKEFARFTDRENPGHLMTGADTASPEQRAELGELFVCDHCGYKTRFPAESSSGESGASTRTDETSDSGDGGEGGNGDRAGAGQAANRSGASGTANRRR